jgi:hypothetical protein
MGLEGTKVAAMAQAAAKEVRDAPITSAMI